MTDFQVIYSIALVNIAVAAILFVAVSKKIESSMVDILVVLYEIFSTDTGGDVLKFEDDFDEKMAQLFVNLDNDEDEDLTDE